MHLLQLRSSWNRPLARKLRARVKRRAGPVRFSPEALEERALLTSFTPIQIRHAYGFDRVGFEDSTHSLVAGDGSGMTIAIVDAYDDPNIASDLAQFDKTYGIMAPPSFTKVNQTGGTIYPAADRGASQEIALDVEYAHAMAPGADLLLVEAKDLTLNNLLAAVTYAAHQPGVVVVSMSWGGDELSTETFYDSRFFTPSGHNGVTFIAASGDDGGILSYPSSSPNVVAVGGTSLYLDSQGNYFNESAWSLSSGGISQYENQPAYQNGVVTQSNTRRTTPDVSFVANPSTGVMVYDTYGGRGLYGGIGGTSLACPIMAGLTAIVDQGRAYLFGRSSYNGTDFLNALYHLPQSDLNDTVNGKNNRFAAGPGYDLLTGRGTPIVDRFVSGMIGAPVYNTLAGTLLVTGGGRGSTDTITFSQSGSQLVVQISAGAPVDGSGIPANQTFTFDSGEYSAVTIATGDGTTTVNVDDSADKSNQGNVMLSSSSLTGLSLGTINFGTGGVSVLTITGGSGNNNYTVTGTPASQGTTLNTGGGVDSVNVQSTAGPLTINSASGSGADVIILGDASSTLSGITAGVTLNAVVTDSLVLNDQGFAAPRTLTVTDTTIAWAGQAVTYSGLGSLTINGGKGGNTFTVLATSATAGVTIIGGGTNDTLAGSNAGNTFALKGNNAGTVNGRAYGSSIIFSQVGNLTAGSGGDTFQFADGASLAGNINGGGTDTLDYSAYSTSVMIDLQTGFATGVGGSIANIHKVTGGTAGGVGVYNILVGNGGNTLTGGNGRRNLLISGSSASTLIGGNEEDILIGGTTAYDMDLASLMAIMDYWSGTPDDYATRVGSLMAGKGVPLLDPTTVTSNGGGSTLTGGPGLNLYYGNASDNTDYDPTSTAVFVPV